MKDAAQELEMPWTEEDSRSFIKHGQIVIPTRDDIRDTILDLVPAHGDEPFLAVELGIGAGWLGAALLARFSGARILGLDGSPTMLREAERHLTSFPGRFELRSFRLEDRSWLSDIASGVRCFISSLVIHHLDAGAKRELYHELYGRLDPGGAVLIADLVAPRSERTRRCLARWWDADVQRQSLELTGSLEGYRAFESGHDNWYAYPDPVDTPSSIPEHLAWLEEAGFLGVDIFWLRSGHAVYGGYKGSSG